MSWDHKFSDLIVAIYRASTELSLNEFREFIFNQTQNVISFDSGAWITNSQAKWLPNEIDYYLHHQPEEMMKNYERVLSVCGIKDPLFEKANILRGKTQITDAQEFSGNNQLNPMYEEHCKPYNLEYGLSTILKSNYHGVDHVVSFYRADRVNPFNEDDRQFAEWLMPHFIEGFRLNLLQYFRKQSSSVGFSAVCDRFGVIVEAEDGFLRDMGLLSETDSNVRQIELDFEHLPTDGLILIDSDTQLKAIQSDGVFYLELQHERSMPELSTRQKEIVNELVKGLPDKIIAKNLNIGLKTVRNQLSDIYRKLSTEGRAGTISYLLSQND